MRSDRTTEELWARRVDEVLGSIGHFSPWVTASNSNTVSRSLLYNAKRPERRQLMETPHLLQYTERDSSPWQPLPQRSSYHNATTGAVYQEILVYFRFLGHWRSSWKENSFYRNEVKIKCGGWCWCQERTAGSTVQLVILSFRFPLETFFIYYKWFFICHVTFSKLKCRIIHCRLFNPVTGSAVGVLFYCVLYGGRIVLIPMCW